MSREEAKNILMMVQAAYPNFSPQDKGVTLNTWHLMLADYPYKQVEAALISFVRTEGKGFPPSIGQIIDKLQTLYGKGEEDMNEIAAWGMVSKAISNSGYHSEEEFAKLPPILQRVVYSPANLRSWAVTDTDTVNGVIQSHVIRTYRAVLKAEREEQKLPVKLRQALEGRRQEKLEAGRQTEGKAGEAGQPAQEPAEEQAQARREQLAELKRRLYGAGNR